MLTFNKKKKKGGEKEEEEEINEHRNDIGQLNIES